MLVDSFGRRIDYLRVSVTSDCNLNCAYCSPRRIERGQAAGAILTDDELVSLVSGFAELGVTKVRVTGGEPLVRPGIESLLARLAGIPGVRDLALSTNGLVLESRANELKKAGVGRVNISLDTLDSGRFREMSGGGDLAAVRRGVAAAIRAGLEPVKLNCVVTRGLNDCEIGEFVRMTEGTSVHVRFIELMPVGDTGFFSPERVVPEGEIKERAVDLEEVPSESWPRGNGPARYYRRPGAPGTVGIIAPLSAGFCSQCNRVRLTEAGILLPCLDAPSGIDLATSLRSGTDDNKMRELIRAAVARKPERHFMKERLSGSPGRHERLMCQMGG